MIREMIREMIEEIDDKRDDKSLNWFSFSRITAKSALSAITERKSTRLLIQPYSLLLTCRNDKRDDKRDDRRDWR